MYLERVSSYYDSSGQQRSGRGYYLILASPNGERIRALYACVRKVAMQQLGQFMMGSARVGGQTIILSGPIGHDGLPISMEELTERARKEFEEVPEDIAEVYWHDDGWNDVGSARKTLLQYGLRLAAEREKRMRKRGK